MNPTIKKICIEQIFKSLDEIKNVNGIGDALYAKIKNYFLRYHILWVYVFDKRNAKRNWFRTSVIDENYEKV